MRWFGVLALGLWLTAAGWAQQRPQDRRAALEARIQEQFLDRAAGELGLDARGRRDLGEVLRRTMERRRELGREGAQVHQALAAAVGNESTPEAEVQRLLERLDSLRERELEVWREEQRELARFLDSRQRARFVFLRARFNERLMEFRRQRMRDRTPGDPPGGIIPDVPDAG